MNSFLENLYDSVKDRRYGVLFFATFLGVLVAFVLGAAFCMIVGVNSWTDFVLPALPGIGIFTLILGWRLIRRARRRRQEQIKFAELSRDEMSKARSKLKSSFKSPPVKQLPDIDLRH